jgi:hypothetical protein
LSATEFFFQRGRELGDLLLKRFESTPHEAILLPQPRAFRIIFSWLLRIQDRGDYLPPIAQVQFGNQLRLFLVRTMPERYAKSFDEKTAATMNDKYDGAICRFNGGYRMVSGMKFENGNLTFQIQLCDHDIMRSARRVEYGDLFNDLLAGAKRI